MSLEIISPGGVITTVRQAHETDAKTDYSTGDLDAESEVITAFNATNTTVNSVLSKLEALGVFLTS